MPFEVKQESVNGQNLLKFCGQIDEEAQFPPAQGGTAPLVIDLKEVTAINSIGIRSWIMWFEAIKGTPIQFLNCPKALVMQMNMVEGFLPESAEVLTMEVPFFCEECDREMEVLFTVGKEIRVVGDEIKLDFKAEELCGAECEIELDVNEKKFFRFLLSRSGRKAA